MSRLFYCIPTYKSIPECVLAVESVYAGSRVPDSIVIIDNSGSAASAIALKPFIDCYKNIHIWPQVKNIGVAPSWNLFLYTLATDYVLIANDDVTVHYDTIARMEAAAESQATAILYGDGSAGNAYSFFIYKQYAFQKYGGFDESFYPAYFEDNDMWYRLHTLNGYTPYFVPGATYTHAVSSTIAKYTQQEKDMHHVYFEKNAQYYMKKWGGAPTHETYRIPFNYTHL